MGQSPSGNPDRRLDSWKEIAAFFGRDERTVRRWEKEHALPVRRIPGGAKGRVFAYETELHQWLSTSEVLDQSPPTQGPQSSSAPLQVHPRQPLFGLRALGKWVATLSVVVALLGIIFAERIAHRSAVHASATTGATPTKPASGNSRSAEAEDLYLKGRYYWNKRTPDDLNRSVDYFTQAIVRDPGYAKAYVGLADSYNLLREYSAMPDNEAYPRALAAATKAVELDDNSAEAHSSLAFVTFYWSWDAAGAEREFKRALALNPNDARAHHWYATFLLTRQRLPEALAQIETARRLDPSSVAIVADKGQILADSGQTESAEVLLKQIETTDPSFTSAHRYLSGLYFERGDYAGFLSEWEKTALLIHNQQELEVAKAAESGFSKGGYHGMLESMLRVQEKLDGQGTLSAYSVAVTCARLGRKDEALRYLRTAYEKRETCLLFLSTEHAFKDLNNDPEFLDLIARIGPSAKPIPPADLLHR